MWKLINVESRHYLINFQFNLEQSSLKIFVWNFDNLWITEFDEKQLLETFTRFNPLIELDKTTLIKEIENIFHKKRNEILWDINIVDTVLKLKVKSYLGCVPFRFEIDFQLINNKLFFQSIVLPLLILLKGMQKQNEHLCDIIRKKDREITEYKLDGAVLSRKTVETPLFDDSLLSIILNENLKKISTENIASLLDENMTEYMDRINQLIGDESTKATKTEEVPTLNEVSNVPEPLKKKFIKSKSMTESKIENIVDTKLPKPTIKKVMKAEKRLQNL